MTDREVLPGCARVRTKCAGKTSVGLWGQSRDPRELSGVTTAGPEWSGCYNKFDSMMLEVKPTAELLVENLDLDHL